MLGSPCDVIDGGVDCDLKESKFKPQSFYKVQFQTNTLGKGINTLPSPQLNSITAILGIK